MTLHTSSRWRFGSRQRRSPSFFVACCFGLGLLVCGHFSGFVAISSSPKRSSSGAQTRINAFPWEAQGSASAERAYQALSAAFPEAVQTGTYFDVPCDKGSVSGRFGGLTGMFGEEVALQMVEKEPILLLRSVAFMQDSLKVLEGFEAESQKGVALEAVKKNPRLLTVPGYEYLRTKPSIDSLALAASAIDTLRPLGQAGLAAVIFGSFVVIILILRPIIYGIGGGPSLIEAVTGGLPTIPRPYELAESYGISLSSLVVLIPLYQVANAFLRRKDT